MPVGTIVHRRECVGSTNDAARELALAGADHGTAVIAAEQTRGRGTKGRVWHSPPGLGLYASFILRGPAAGLYKFTREAGRPSNDWNAKTATGSARAAAAATRR